MRAVFPGRRAGRWGLVSAFLVSLLLAMGVPTAVASLAPVSNTATAASQTITNTAWVNYSRPGTVGPGGPVIEIPSNGGNPVVDVRIPPADPAVLTFHQYAPGGIDGSVPILFDGGSFFDESTGTFVNLPAPVSVTGQPIATGTAVPVREGEIFHVGEPVFITLRDANRNIDRTRRELVEITVVASTGDTERLLLLETGPDTGIFAAVIQTQDAADGLRSFDGRLSVVTESRLRVTYIDPYYPLDRLQDDALVDPLGVVFDSRTGEPVDGAVVTMVDIATGEPAVVYGDDGKSLFPSTLVSGGGEADAGAALAAGVPARKKVTDSSGYEYEFPPGGFRFPYVQPGNYRLEIRPPGTYTAPSVVAPGDMPLSPSGERYLVRTGSYGEVFNVPLGPAIKVDIPVDPHYGQLVLSKRVSQPEAVTGDFLQYRLEVDNADPLHPVAAVRVIDVLPAGFSYQAGSLRIDGQRVDDPVVSADGRTLTIPVGDLDPRQGREVRYVALVGAGAPKRGEAINTAEAIAGDDIIRSNRAQASVVLREPFMTERYTIIGRVYEGDCGQPMAALKGVGGVRLQMEDGTYVTTDSDGQYHFEAVRPGTHVVQLDLDTLPPVLEPVSCIDNTRFAGNSWSQFVEADGGMLWRADFFLRPREESVGIRIGTLAPAVTESPAEAAPVTTPEAAATPARPESVAPGMPVESSLDEFEVRFPECEAEPDSSGEAVLARVTASHPAASVTRVEVIGHTDSRRLSPACAARFGDNRRLSEARAQAVAGRLREAWSLEESRLAVEGRGPDTPRAANDQDEGRARNRRTEGRVYYYTPEVPESAPPAAAPVPAVGYRVELDGTGPVRDLQVLALLPEGFRLEPGSVQLGGQPVADPAVAESLLTFRLGEVTYTRPWQKELTFRVLPGDTGCTSAAEAVKVLANIESLTGDTARTPVADSRVGCGVPAVEGEAPQASERQTVRVEGVRARAVDPDLAARQQRRAAIPDTATAAGANADWFADRAPGVAWVFPPVGHVPRAPAVRIVVEHAPGQSVTLYNAKGEPVSAFHYDGVELDATERRAVSIWRAVPLADGDNAFRAVVSSAAGRPVAELPGTVVFAGPPVRAELVPEQSVLRADGVTPPVVAIRLYDRDGNPVRHGVTGNYRLSPPYAPKEQVERQQQRKLAGMERFQPTWRVEGDEGIAYLDLLPTTEAGNVEVDFVFQTSGAAGQQAQRNQEVTAWLEATPRDWIVVGFAEGTVGYRTLRDKLEPLPGAGTGTGTGTGTVPPEDSEEGAWHEGQVSLYARGRVRGDWLATIALDTDKDDQADRRESVLSGIDPDEYYTLYGDRATQANDAPTQDRLYLRLERGQFYAMFGDYKTGMTRSELSRYDRPLNGVKVEDGGGRLTWILFAAETSQSFARDDIQGNGTSGLYRLSGRGILINSERVRIETRDRQDGTALRTQSLARHLDYDIDYSNGTLFFRQPVPARDADFNPVIIVVDYETSGAATEELNGGGRIAVALDDKGRAVLGISAVRDDDGTGATKLGGADFRFKLGADTELRLEAAATDGDAAAVSREGEAWLAEVEHHSGVYDAKFYTRRQDPGFGVGQQSAIERGQQNTGVEGQVRLDDQWRVIGRLSSLESLASGDRRMAGQGEVRYETRDGGIGVGAQVVEDEPGSADTDPARSEQLRVSASRWFLDRRLELSAQADTALGGSSDSVDYPDRLFLGAGYRLTPETRFLAGQEFTEGGTFDTLSTRVGLETSPWAGARLQSTLNQSEMNEYGPRTFGQYGLTQALVLNARWGLDFTFDASNTFNESAVPPVVVDEDKPVAPAGVLDTTAVGLTEDYHAATAGATYRAPLWSWNARVETRDGEVTDRHGLVTNFLREATAGVAFASSARAFWTKQEAGMDGVLASVDFSLAWRPLGSSWAVLNRLEARYESVGNGQSLDDPLFGNTGLLADDASTRRITNNLVLNRVSREWTGTDRTGNLFRRYERNQWSLFYGARYAIDQFDGTEYSGYTDLVGFLVRHDLSPRWDIGLQAASLNTWETHDHAWSFGPMVGWSPVKNGWVTLGYNVRGFYDRDFDAARYTTEGVYLQLRLKFDQTTRLWKGKEDADAAR